MNPTFKGAAHWRWLNSRIVRRSDGVDVKRQTARWWLGFKDGEQVGPGKKTATSMMQAMDERVPMESQCISE